MRVVRGGRIALCVLTWLTLPNAAATSGFTGLGDLPLGQFESRLYGLSGDGRVAVGSSRTLLNGSSSASEAFRWTHEGGMQGLGGFVPGRYPATSAWGASADGSVVVGVAPFFDAGVAFRWTAESGLQSLAEDFPLGINATSALAVSADGSVMVGWGSPVVGRAPFRWTAETGLVSLGHLPFAPRNQPITEATGVSADGSVVVGTSITNAPNQGGVYEAFRWTEAEGMIGLGDLPGGRVLSTGRAISADGETIVGSSEGTFITGGRAEYQVFRWTEAEGMVALGGLRERHIGSGPLGVSHDGSLIAGYSDSPHTSNQHNAFLWDAENGMRDLNEVLVEDYGDDLTGWRLINATISADGRVVGGDAENPSGNREAWIATLAVEVDLDIHPGTKRHRIRPGSRSTVRVALHGSEVLPAEEIDAASLRFGPDGAEPVRPRGRRPRDVDGDGFDDLLVRFRMRDTGIAIGDVEACVVGRALDGRELEGCGLVDTIPRCGSGYGLLALLLPLAVGVGARRRGAH